MTVDQRERRELQEALVSSIGAEHTDTLLGYLPPVGWADVATKTDLDHLATIIDKKFEANERRFEATGAKIEAAEQRILAHLHKELKAQYHRLVVVTVTVMTTIIGILLGAFTAIVKLT